MNKERLAGYRDIAIIVLSALILSYISVKYLAVAVLPFLISWGIAFAVRRPSAFVARKTRIPERVTRPVLAVLLLLAVLGAVGFAGYAILIEAWQLISQLASGGKLEELFSSFVSTALGLFGKMGISEELKENILSSLSGVIGSLLSRLGAIVSRIAASVPKIILFLLVSVIAAVYFSADLERVNKAIHRLLPKRVDKLATELSKNGMRAAASYARSYFFILILTFVMMLSGLLILRVEYALLLAFVISVLDILPVIGIGVILIPWGAIELAFGNTYLAVGLFILYAVSTVVRQIAEPKILGKNLGIHPLLSLFLMYVGYAVFGIFGLLLLPLAGALFACFRPKSDKENAADVV